MIDRLPHDIEAEQALIGCVILKPDVFDTVSPLVTSTDFFDQANATIYATIERLSSGGVTPSHITIIEALKTSGRIESAGGIAHITRCTSSVVNWSGAKYHAKQIADASRRRRLIELAEDAARIACDASQDLDGGLSEIEARMHAVRDNGRIETLEHISDAMRTAIEQIEAVASGEVEAGLPTGFYQLDKCTGGFAPGRLIILAARPSVGKSALAMNVCKNISTQKTVLFVSLEMSKQELCERLLADLAEVDGRKFRTGLEVHQIQRAKDAAENASLRHLWIDDRPIQRVGDIASSARKAARKSGGKLGLIAVDYLQLITPDDRRMNRQEQVAMMARDLKQLARTMECPVLCLAQLNREADNASGAIPRLSHLRESGAIEQDADIVAFVHRPSMYSDKEPRDKAKIIIAKHRGGPTGETTVDWREQWCRFEDFEPAISEHQNYRDEFAEGSW